eukprot:TRINITY_DN9285_c1_g1_i1.p1 TRINITY_DN9285_c1_g1~~TRINITY_DN9285_c1_g1_i1.p1  ORF type:complete len:401 (+),score=116.65 TRINITY_DN9285_c1_g1_i1:189-1391(+)
MQARTFFHRFRARVKTMFPTKKKKVERCYEILETIGSGNYSEVKHAISKKTGEEVALKIINKRLMEKSEDFYDRDTLMNEIDILKKYSKHPNIITLKEVFEDRKRLILVLELMRGGEVLEQLRKRKYYSEKEACHLMKKILSAVAFLHSCGVVHRDLKPENLLFTSDGEDAEIKIADFGFARYIGDGCISNEECGSLAYIAPEIVNSLDYGKAVDMWSLGVILYIMLCGFPPFYDDDMDKMVAQIKLAKYDFSGPWWSKVSDEAKDLVSNLLQVDPNKRLTAEGALSHTWIKGLSTSTGVLPTLDFVENIKKSSAEFKVTFDVGNEIHRGEDHLDHPKERRQQRPKRERTRRTEEKSKKEVGEKEKESSNTEIHHSSSQSSLSSSASENEIANQNSMAFE